MADRWLDQNLSVAQQVTEIYIATFKRAPDAAGLTYWVDQVNTGRLTIEQVAQSFFDQPETQARYPSGTTTAAFVAAVYDNALGRVPDAEGLNYWVTQLDHGAVAPDLFILSILRGAHDDPGLSPPTRDDTQLTHQRLAAEYYADSVAATVAEFDVAEATAVLAAVTVTSWAAARVLVDQYALSGGSGQTLTLATNDVRTVDGSNFAGSLNLGITLNEESNVTALNDEDAETTVTLTGTAGEEDALSFNGAVVTTPATTVSGFETLVFGGRAAGGGTFDATNVLDVGRYDIAWLGAALEINDMDGEETVAINVEDGLADEDITLIAGRPATTHTLTVEFYAENPEDFQNFGSPFSIQDFRTVTLDLGGARAADWDYVLDLVFLDGAGLAPDDVDFDAETVYARTLHVIGGVDQDRDAGEVDTVDLGELQTALTWVDVSAYNGEVTGGWADGEGSNATIRVNEYDLVWTIGGTQAAGAMTEASEFITAFRFTEDGYAEGVVWQIDGFQAFNDPSGLITLGNLTILDLRDLGVEGLADITIQTGDVFWGSLSPEEQAEYDAAIDSEADTVITSNEGLDFTILLTGVAPGALSNENFAFAA